MIPWMLETLDGTKKQGSTGMSQSLIGAEQYREKPKRRREGIEVTSQTAPSRLPGQVKAVEFLPTCEADRVVRDGTPTTT